MRGTRSAVATGLALVALYFAAVYSLQAFYQSRDSNYNKNASAAATYQGPGDITSGAIAFYSAGRAYNAAYAAAQSSLADIVDTATGLAACTIKVGTNGFANLTAVACPTGAPTVSVTTFCTVTHAACSITKLYDQTGTGNHAIQATLANMPGLTLSAQNGLPCAAGTGNASTTLAVQGSISQSVPFSYTAVAERTGSVTTQQGILGNNATNRGALRWTVSANTFGANNGTGVALTGADNAPHAAIVVVSNTAPLFALDSSANIVTTTNGTTALSQTEQFMNMSGPQGLLAGFVCEAGIWPADLNSSYQAMLANMRSATNGWNF